MPGAQTIQVDMPALTQRLRDHVERLAGLIGPRHEGKPSSIDAAREYVARELSASGDTVYREVFPSRGEQKATNLYITRPGTKQPQRVVVLGAHYDTVSTTPGADDNASAVAGLLETARLLSGIEAARTIRYIGFANEEPPHFYTQTMGSQFHARKCRERRDQITAMICLEMIGYFADAPGSQTYPAPVAWLAKRLFGGRGNFIASVSNLRSARLVWPFRRGFKRGSKLPLKSIALPQAIDEIRLSDHGPFWDEGFPAMMITDTSFFRNPHYHQPSDTPDTLDYERLAEVTVGVASAVLRLAKGRAKLVRN